MRVHIGSQKISAGRLNTTRSKEGFMFLPVREFIDFFFVLVPIFKEFLPFVLFRNVTIPKV